MSEVVVVTLAESSEAEEDRNAEIVAETEAGENAPHAPVVGTGLNDIKLQNPDFGTPTLIPPGTPYP